MNENLPWRPERDRPLMLAPMQGLTNRALRGLFGEWVRPDVMFTEFIRVRPGSRQAISRADRLEAAGSGDIPLVVQLIGRDTAALVAAAEAARQSGAVHLNLNLGCPFGRMSNGSAGGALLKNPVDLDRRLTLLRQCAPGSLSVKVRSGYDDPEQIFSLLAIFEGAGVDFIVLHPRTVVQKYNGAADHDLTARVAAATVLPVIANGDVTTAGAGQRVLAETGASGLMIGRGAIRDPLLFERLRGRAAAQPARAERSAELQYYIAELTARYRLIFQGDAQILNKLKTVLNMLADDPVFARPIRKMLRAKSLAELTALAGKLADYQ
ncbi:MAG: tRNA-dihydrouridine synthase family protein [Desulfurivibrionaceae bacterium]|nr:tRNA-dihydrouridine synthase family protein [Desulfurivibrionaceae bacterium]